MTKFYPHCLLIIRGGKILSPFFLPYFTPEKKFFVVENGIETKMSDKILPPLII